MTDELGSCSLACCSANAPARWTSLEALILCSILAGAGSASLVSYVIRCRWRCSVAQVWSGFAEFKAAVEIRMRDRDAACWEAAQTGRAEAFEQFIAGFWVERRQYRRQHRSLFRNRESLVLAERPCFRNMPLAHWIEHEFRLV